MDADFLAKGCTKIGSNWNCVDSTADLSTLPEYVEQDDTWYERSDIVKGVKNSYLTGGAVVSSLVVCCCSFMFMMMSTR